MLEILGDEWSLSPPPSYASSVGRKLGFKCLSSGGTNRPCGTNGRMCRCLADANQPAKITIPRGSLSGEGFPRWRRWQPGLVVVVKQVASLPACHSGRDRKIPDHLNSDLKRLSFWASQCKSAHDSSCVSKHHPPSRLPSFVKAQKSALLWPTFDQLQTALGHTSLTNSFQSF